MILNKETEQNRLQYSYLILIFFYTIIGFQVIISTW